LSVKYYALSLILSLVVPLFLAQPLVAAEPPPAIETQERIRLAGGPANIDSQQWSGWRPAQAADFTWTPPGAFWRGFIKTSRAGRRSGIFVAVFTPLVDLNLDQFDSSAVLSFAGESATLVGKTQFVLSGYRADNLIFSSTTGNGLYFGGDSIPTMLSLVHIKLEKEKTSPYYPFLVFCLATPASAFDAAEAEFEQYVQQTRIQPPTASRQPPTAKGEGKGLPSTSTSASTSACRFGIGFRQRLDGISGLAVNARIGDFVPDASFDCELDHDNGRWENDYLSASLGLNYFFLQSHNAHFGVGVTGTDEWQVLSDRTFSVQVPLTVEYFLTSRFSVQAGCGLYVDFRPGEVNSTRFDIGPGSLTGSLGFTWYVE
jgi:hypothetical protein